MSTRAEVNARLLRTDIRGKAYIDVAQRIDGFWELYPEGALVTELLADDGNRCTFRATAYDGEGRRLATGHAFEERSGRVNTTSYIENCETSAVGRALGNLGIGSTEHVASADEVQGALEAQGGEPREQAETSTSQPSSAERLLKAKRQLAEACRAYEAVSRRDAEAGWAAAGVKRRPDYPKADAPADEQAEWFEAVAYEFESEIQRINYDNVQMGEQ